jgi:hypothetical protein
VQDYVTPTSTLNETIYRPGCLRDQRRHDFELADDCDVASETREREGAALNAQ